MAETAFWSPIERKCFGSVQCPRPVHAVVQRGRVATNFCRSEVLAASERTTEQDRHIDGRDLRLAKSLASVFIHKVMQESVFSGSVANEEMECVRHTWLNFRPRAIPALTTDAQRSQAKSCRRDAGLSTGAAAVRIGAVQHQTTLRVGFIPETLESGSLKFIEQGRITEFGLRMT